MGNIIDKSLFSDLDLRTALEKWFKDMESEGAEEFLEILLKVMSLVFQLNVKDFRRNIEGFSGRYLFMSKDKGITVSAVFKDTDMTVAEGVIDNPDIAITFRNGKALMDYILSPKPDILGSMLRQDVTLDGNLNYLYKFAYMAKHLQLMARGEA